MYTKLLMREYEPKIDLYFWVDRQVTLLNEWRVRIGDPNSLEFKIGYVQKRWWRRDKVVYKWVSWEDLKEPGHEYFYNRCGLGGY